MQVTTDNTWLEIHERYWCDWRTVPDWGNWFPCRPKIEYPYEEGKLEPVLKVMQKRIAKIQARRPGTHPAECKIVKVRTIKIIEDEI